MRHPIIATLRTWRGAALALSLASFVASALPSAAGAANSSTQWPMFGQNLNNTASAPATNISTINVTSLKPKWTFTPSGDVSARPAVLNGVAYFPDWGGNLYAINSANGKLIWSKNFTTDYGFAPQFGSTFVLSRTSPFFDASSNTLYVGTQATANGAYLLAVNAANGSLRWKAQLDTHPQSVDTQSPVVYSGVVYVGVSSLEEGAAAFPGYTCCTFQGSMLAVNAATGAIIWKTYTTSGTSLPADPALGYTGNSVWGSTAVVDPARNQVYFTTGNNYKDPTGCPATLQPGCLSPNDHVDSVLAVDMSTGAIKWAKRLSDGDDWNVACFSAGINCPPSAGPDYDFGSGANLITYQTPSGPKTILGAGQKSGRYSAFNPDTGAVLWSTLVGPGSSLGGMEWGSATDGQRIYVAIANFGLYGPNPYPTGSSLPAGTVGSWSALDPATGTILWQTADPNLAIDIGPMTVANGVVYAPSTAGSSTSQNMFALNAATGKILWSYAAGGSVNAGAVIANDTVYWGSGYGHFGSQLPMFTPHQGFYAFTLGGQ
jgi:polyvinyl alcohol dehydrogenase (cytochrome)